MGATNEATHQWLVNPADELITHPHGCRVKLLAAINRLQCVQKQKEVIFALIFWG